MSEEFNIEDIFDGIPADEIPDNRPKEILKQNLHLIVAGGTSFNYFEVLFPYDEEAVRDITIIYKQLEKVTLVKTPTYIEKRPNSFIAVVTLSPEESMLFGNSLLDTEAQVRIVSYNDDLIYTDKFKMNVVDTLQEVVY